MADGSYRPIESVEEGDWVLADSPEDASPPQPRRVLRTHDNYAETVVVLTVDGRQQSRGRIYTTTEHPFWTQDGWVAAGELRVGDSLRGPTGELAQVSRVSVERFSVSTYNLTVEDLGTYFVGAGGIDVLVHNQDEGIIYLRTDAETGAEYVGRATSQDNFRQRQRIHRRHNAGRSFVWRVLERVPAGGDLGVAEESWLRAGGGPRAHGGRLDNDIWAIGSDTEYRSRGGTVDSPSGVRRPCP